MAEGTAEEDMCVKVSWAPTPSSRWQDAAIKLHLYQAVRL